MEEMEIIENGEDPYSIWYRCHASTCRKEVVRASHMNMFSKLSRNCKGFALLKQVGWGLFC
jgi:hypothetical protein